MSFLFSVCVSFLCIVNTYTWLLDVGLFVSVNLSNFFLLLFAILSIFHYYEGVHFDMVSFSEKFPLSSFSPLTFIQFILCDDWFVEIMFHLLLLLFLFLSFVWTLTLINSFSFVMLAILLYLSFSFQCVYHFRLFLYILLHRLSVCSWFLFLFVIKTCLFVVACWWFTSSIVLLLLIDFLTSIHSLIFAFFFIVIWFFDRIWFFSSCKVFQTQINELSNFLFFLSDT